MTITYSWKAESHTDKVKVSSKVIPFLDFPVIQIHLHVSKFDWEESGQMVAHFRLFLEIPGQKSIVFDPARNDDDVFTYNILLQVKLCNGIYSTSSSAVAVQTIPVKAHFTVKDVLDYIIGVKQRDHYELVNGFGCQRWNATVLADFAGKGWVGRDVNDMEAGPLKVLVDRVRNLYGDIMVYDPPGHPGRFLRDAVYA
ncbi:hypothetical protein CC1G_01627 [Coprinopsis cinerea okayama7|uniref:DUF7770 domain-containing protein n=1 Tax=Coprinopsis cinerea (strain Okayama-7 / 130 / ATCC MYA-4618 / FGSC 9003) TaxID=240176 RepID=A8NIA4_COPC7|nr:hypothetical protein CC1G_01627 [Coprinopsis cinerea okayama7\|eukprot:XP_001833950.1 hypothetical protein CC1G_01627 [Coprinopsis cinerea okayama7\